MYPPAWIGMSSGAKLAVFLAVAMLIWWPVFAAYAEEHNPIFAAPAYALLGWLALVSGRAWLFDRRH